MSPNREDYLKAIFIIAEENEVVTNKNLSTYLGVSKPSVSEMMKKLEHEGLIEIKKSAIGLSNKGSEIAKKLVSKHRLWELFLLEKLSYDWNDVHKQADLLEHVTDDLLLDALNKFLNYPETCPHGSIIFENYNRELEELLPLSSYLSGERGLIRKFSNEASFLKYFSDKGLALNMEFEMICTETSDEKFSIKIEDKTILISEKAAKYIYTKKI